MKFRISAQKQWYDSDGKVEEEESKVTKIITLSPKEQSFALKAAAEKKFMRTYDFNVEDMRHTERLLL